MRMLCRILITLVLCAPAYACIWDYDTLRDERRGLPGVAEVLAGRFEKRSQFFYTDRIARMQKLLASNPNNQDAIDNLAVALFRIGRTQEAVHALLDKEKRFPSQYTTASNLATFYMLGGENTKAIGLLENALKINPNAHFGREKYQLKLAEFLQKAQEAQEYPLADFLGTSGFLPKAVAPDRRITQSKWNSKPGLPPDQQQALNAIVGMIRFGTDQSPDLFFAMGNLLNQRGNRHLAARAYRRSIDLLHPRSKEIQMLIESTEGVIHPEEPQADKIVAKEVAEGQAWSQAYMDFADDLVRSGKDPDDERNYAKFYEQNGPSVDPLPLKLEDLIPRRKDSQFIAGIVALCVVLLGYKHVRSRLRKRRRATGPING